MSESSKAKRLSIKSVKFEDTLRALLQTPPPPSSKKAKRKKGE